MKPHKTTQLIQAGEVRVGDAVPLTTPVYTSTTFVFESAREIAAYNEGRSSKYLYSRYANPTVVAVERQLASLDGAGAALVFASGMGATAAALLTLAGAGDEIVCASAVYGGTAQLLSDVIARLGITVRFVPLEDLTAPERLVRAETRVVWFESPTNPTLRCVDIARVASICRESAVACVFDNTFATPLNQQPLALGVDLAMQSATKYLNGHSDVTAGVLSGPAAAIARIDRTRRVLGAVIDPWAASQLGRGVKTLPLRVAQQNAGAERVAAFLESDRRVSRVYYPGLPSHPDHEVAARQMAGYGGMVTFDLEERFDRAEACFDRLRLIKRATSLGGVESLASLPVLTSHWGLSDDQLRAAGITKGLVRLSVGLEDPDDLVADLDHALGP